MCLSLASKRLKLGCTLIDSPKSVPRQMYRLIGTQLNLLRLDHGDQPESSK